MSTKKLVLLFLVVLFPLVSMGVDGVHHAGAAKVRSYLKNNGGYKSAHKKKAAKKSVAKHSKKKKAKKVAHRKSKSHRRVGSSPGY